MRGTPPPCRPRPRVPARDARRSPPRGRRTGAAQRPRVGPRQFRRRRAPARAPPPGLRTAARRPSSRSRRDPAPRARRRSRSPRAAAATPSHSRSTVAGSCSTRTSCGHIASASPSRIPGCTPASSAAAVTGPTSGSVPGTGASAAGASASLGLSRSAARSWKPGMRRQAIMGTYVLYPNRCSCQTFLNSRPEMSIATGCSPLSIQRSKASSNA